MNKKESLDDEQTRKESDAVEAHMYVAALVRYSVGRIIIIKRESQLLIIVKTGSFGPKDFANC